MKTTSKIFRGQKLWPECRMKLQSFTQYLVQTLVFKGKGTLQEKLNFLIS